MSQATILLLSLIATSSEGFFVQGSENKFISHRNGERKDTSTSLNALILVLRISAASPELRAFVCFAQILQHQFKCR